MGTTAQPPSLPQGPHSPLPHGPSEAPGATWLRTLNVLLHQGSPPALTLLTPTCPKHPQAQSDPEPPLSHSREPPSSSAHIPTPLPRTPRPPGPTSAGAPLHTAPHTAAAPHSAARPRLPCRTQLPLARPRPPHLLHLTLNGAANLHLQHGRHLAPPPSGQLFPPPPANHRPAAAAWANRWARRLPGGQSGQGRSGTAAGRATSGA